MSITNTILSSSTSNIVILSFSCIFIILFLIEKLMEGSMLWKLTDSKKKQIVLVFQMIKTALLLTITILSSINIIGYKENTVSFSNPSLDVITLDMSTANAIESIFLLSSSSPSEAQSNLSSIALFIEQINKNSILNNISFLLSQNTQYESVINFFYNAWTNIFQFNANILSTPFQSFKNLLLQMQWQFEEFPIFISSIFAGNTNSIVISQIESLDIYGNQAENVMQSFVNVFQGTNTLNSSNISSLFTLWTQGTILNSLLNMFLMTESQLVSFLQEWVNILPYEITITGLSNQLQNSYNTRNFLWQQFNLQGLSISSIENVVSTKMQELNSFITSINSVTTLNGFISFLQNFSSLYLSNQIMNFFNSESISDLTLVMQQCESEFPSGFNSILSSLTSFNSAISLINLWNISPTNNQIEQFNSSIQSYEQMIQFCLTNGNSTLLQQVISWISNAYLSAVQFFLNPDLLNNINYLVQNTNLFLSTFQQSVSNVFNSFQNVFPSLENVPQVANSYSNLVLNNETVFSFPIIASCLTPSPILQMISSIGQGFADLNITSETSSQVINYIANLQVLKSNMISVFSLDPNNSNSAAQLATNINSWIQWCNSPSSPFIPIEITNASDGIALANSQFNAISSIISLNIQPVTLDQMNSFYHFVHFLCGMGFLLTASQGDLNAISYFSSNYDSQISSGNEQILSIYPNKNFFITNTISKNFTPLQSQLNVTQLQYLVDMVYGILNINGNNLYAILKSANQVFFRTYYYYNDLFQIGFKSTNVQQTNYVDGQGNKISVDLSFSFQDLLNLNSILDLFLLSVYSGTRIMIANSNDSTNTNVLIDLISSYYNSFNGYTTLYPSLEFGINTNELYNSIYQGKYSFTIMPYELVDAFGRNSMLYAMQSSSVFTLSLMNYINVIFQNPIINLDFLGSNKTAVIEALNSNNYGG